MSVYNIPNLTGGVDEVLVQVVSTVPQFMIGTLLFIFFMVLISGTGMQKKRTGYADIQLWSVLASLSVLLISILATLKPGLMNLETLGIVVAVTIFSGLWFYLSRGRGEF